MQSPGFTQLLLGSGFGNCCTCPKDSYRRYRTRSTLQAGPVCAVRALPTLQNRTQETSSSAQIVPRMRFLVFEFAVYTAPLCDVRSWHSVCCWAGVSAYPLPMACPVLTQPRVLCQARYWYGRSGTDVAYGGTSVRHYGCNSYQTGTALRACYAMSGTDMNI
eukprot:3940580-Rhodomonas_salina.3